MSKCPGEYGENEPEDSCKLELLNIAIHNLTPGIEIWVNVLLA